MLRVLNPQRYADSLAHFQYIYEYDDVVSFLDADVGVEELVSEEASKGDDNAAALRLASIADIPILEAVDQIDGLAREYADALKLPDKAQADAYHMALATWHGIDYLVSWNCTHIASGRVQKVLMGVNNTKGFQTPILCTPEELMEV